MLDLEYNVLGTILVSPQAAAVAEQILSRIWGHCWTSSETQTIAASIKSLRDAGRLPDRRAVRDDLELNGQKAAILALPAIVQRCESVDFLEQRCQDLLTYAQIRLAEAIGHELIETAKHVTDVDSYLDQLQGKVSAATGAKVKVMTADEAGQVNWNNWLDRRANSGSLLGIPTGFRALDNTMNGFQFGKPYVLGARPSHGKTALACHHAYAAAAAGYPVFIFAHEMDSTDYTLRMACALAMVDSNPVLSGKLNAATAARFMTAVDEIRKLPIFLCDDPQLSPRQAWSLAHTMKAKAGKAGLIIVDYLQLERIPNWRGTRTEQVATLPQGWLNTRKATRPDPPPLSPLNLDFP